jgi:uncharacterized protein
MVLKKIHTAGRYSSARLLTSAALLVSFCLFPSFALDVPALTGRVVDNAGIINDSDENDITKYLDSLDNTTGIQIAVLTIPSLEGADLESYSYSVAHEWKLGQKGKDNGALLLVSVNDHKIRIEVGYGLEEKLTDAKCGLIIRNVIAPEFRKGDYTAGITEGVKNMGGIASDDATLVARSVADGTTEEDSDSQSAAIFAFVFFFIFFFMIMPNIAGRRSWWLPWFFFPSLWNTGSHSGTHFDDHHSGFSGGGGFGGGGFSGGGGGFGGGGASGGW